LASARARPDAVADTVSDLRRRASLKRSRRFRAAWLTPGVRFNKDHLIHVPPGAKMRRSGYAGYGFFTLERPRIRRICFEIYEI